MNYLNFNIWYNSKQTNTFEILLELFKNDKIKEDDINILVGCTSSDNNDYLRFKDSDFYNLYIDNDITNVESEKQYYMYTINYSDLNYINLEKGIVNNIHFDTQVSYFSPRDYLQISEHLLKPGGKIIFNINQQHGGNIIYKNNLTDELKNQLEIDYGININLQNNKIEINYDNFFDKSLLDPQYHFFIIDNNFKKIPWPRWNNKFNEIYENNDMISEDIKKLIDDNVVDIRDYILNKFNTKYLYIEGTKKLL